MEHRTAALTGDELNAEIARAYELGADVPRFCTAPYIAGNVCLRIGDHDGEHVTKGRTGRLIGWDA